VKVETETGRNARHRNSESCSQIQKQLRTRIYGCAGSVTGRISSGFVGRCSVFGEEPTCRFSHAAPAQDPKPT